MSRQSKSRKRNLLWVRLCIPWCVLVLLILLVRSNRTVYEVEDFGLEAWQATLENRQQVVEVPSLAEPSPNSTEQEVAEPVESPYWGFSEDTELHSLPQPVVGGLTFGVETANPSLDTTEQEVAEHVESPYWGFSEDTELHSLPQPVEGGLTFGVETAKPSLDSTEQEVAEQVQSPYWGFSEDTELHSLPQPVEGGIALGVETQDDATYWETFEETTELALEAPEEPPAIEPRLEPEASASLQEKEPLAELGEPQTLHEIESPLFPLHTAPDAVTKQPIRLAVPGTQKTQQMQLSAEERRLLIMIEHDALSVTTGKLTDSRLEESAREKITAACTLSQRGATFAARRELIEVLRLVSQAKDNREGTRLRSESLAAGLRALEEADDFLPRGTQLEADMDLRVICDSHRTPIGRELADTDILPTQMADRYNRYAQIKLALSVAGEPAGSMALYTLGKLNSQLAVQEPERDRQCQRRALAFQQSALLAHNQNYLAAHELGVLMAESGHLREASHLFAQVAQRQPHAVVYRNLARVEEERGRHNEALFCRTEAARLASRGLGSNGQVAWVSPEEFARNAPPIPAAPTRSAPQVAQSPSSRPYH